MELVAQLLDKSLIQPSDTVDGEPRFRMLETIREYALEQLTASGEEEAVKRRHADFYLRLAETAEPHLGRPERDVWLERLESSGGIDGPTARQLLARARRIFYADRTEEHLLSQWEAAIGSNKLQRILLATGGQITDIKAEDARCALALADQVTTAHAKERMNGVRH